MIFLDGNNVAFGIVSGFRYETVVFFNKAAVIFAVNSIIFGSAVIMSAVFRYGTDISVCVIRAISNNVIVNRAVGGVIGGFSRGYYCLGCTIGVIMNGAVIFINDVIIGSAVLVIKDFFDCLPFVYKISKRKSPFS